MSALVTDPLYYNLIYNVSGEYFSVLMFCVATGLHYAAIIGSIQGIQ